MTDMPLLAGDPGAQQDSPAGQGRLIRACQPGPADVTVRMDTGSIQVRVDPDITHATLTLTGDEGTASDAEVTQTQNGAQSVLRLQVTAPRPLAGGNLAGATIANSVVVTGQLVVAGNFGVVDFGGGGTRLTGASPSARAAVEITLPPGSSLVTETTAADVVISTLTGQGATLAHLRCTTASGDVDVDRVQIDQAHVTTNSGDFTTSLITGAAGINTTSGDVHVDGYTGTDMSINAVSGDVHVSGIEAAGRFTIATVSGDIRLRGDLPENATIKTISGRIRHR